MPKKECKIALDLYKKFLIRMEKVAEFLKVAEVRALGFVSVILSSTCVFLSALNCCLAKLVAHPYRLGHYAFLTILSVKTSLNSVNISAIWSFIKLLKLFQYLQELLILSRGVD